MTLFERLHIERGLLLAPMEDVTDMPFRLICKRFGADMVFTEFVNADGLVCSRKPTKTRLKLIVHEEERPVGVQIYGSDIESLCAAACIVEEAQPDVLDINAGCWVRKIANRGAGAGLLKDPERLAAIAAEIVRRVSVPVTVKTRLGWDAADIRIVEVAKMLEDAGVAAITVHCRTRDQAHTGPVDWSWIPKIRRAVSIPVVLNGGVFTAEDAGRAFETTACDAVMIARGAIGYPWIFREAKRYLATGEVPTPPNLEERVRTVLEHLGLAVPFKGEKRAVLEMRKYYTGYFRNVRDGKFIRMALMKAVTVSEVEDILSRFLAEKDDGT
ncbi:MAG: tRNA dihydrouridine synthase DusB [Bacteroidota bacterium]|nr:tRNA dihydrouridine synthase DusB [Bacteroidota bacterium]